MHTHCRCDCSATRFSAFLIWQVRLLRYSLLRGDAYVRKAGRSLIRLPPRPVPASEPMIACASGPRVVTSVDVDSVAASSVSLAPPPGYASYLPYKEGVPGYASYDLLPGGLVLETKVENPGGSAGTGR